MTEIHIIHAHPPPIWGMSGFAVSPDFTVKKGVGHH